MPQSARRDERAEHLAATAPMRRGATFASLPHARPPRPTARDEVERRATRAQLISAAVRSRQRVEHEAARRPQSAQLRGSRPLGQRVPVEKRPERKPSARTLPRVPSRATMPTASQQNTTVQEKAKRATGGASRPRARRASLPTEEAGLVMDSADQERHVLRTLFSAKDSPLEPVRLSSGEDVDLLMDEILDRETKLAQEEW